MLEKQEGTQAVVGKVELGKDEFVVAYTHENGALPKGTCVTFSIKDWMDEDPPLKGQIVLLVNIQKFIKGWRARKAYAVKAESQKK